MLFVVLPGFEPRQADPESDVLPLHHRTISFFAFFFYLKAGAKVLTFSELTKYFFAIAFLSLSYLLYISVLFALFFYWVIIPDADIRCRLSLLSDRNLPLAAVPFFAVR